jgi:hypothetical protein
MRDRTLLEREYATRIVIGMQATDPTRALGAKRQGQPIAISPSLARHQIGQRHLPMPDPLECVLYDMLPCTTLRLAREVLQLTAAAPITGIVATGWRRTIRRRFEQLQQSPRA